MTDLDSRSFLWIGCQLCLDPSIRSSSGKASAVGDKPGVTRAVLTSIRVSNRPLVYLIDTPGVMVPNIADMHVGLKLALCCKDKKLHLISFSLLIRPPLPQVAKVGDLDNTDHQKSKQEGNGPTW